MYREPYTCGSLIVLKRGEMMPHQYQLSDFYYAFDEKKWFPFQKEWGGPMFYSMSNLEFDKHQSQILDLIKTLLCKEPEATAFYCHSEQSFGVVK